MNLHENSDFGRKVFFVDFSELFKANIVPVLLENEIELYVIDSYKNAKNILRLYPDSICFICIDRDLPPENWFNFIMSFEHDPMLSTIFFGIASERNDEDVKNHFLLNATIPAGFISLNINDDALVDNLMRILDLNGAKGKRRFVRADCEDDVLVSADCTIDGARIPLKITDISSAGVSCRTEEKFAGFFKPNMLIRDLSISLRSKKIQVSSIVIHSSVKGNALTVILLFTKGMSIASQKIVREYVQYCLQKEINDQLMDSPPDKSNYAKRIEGDTSDAFLISIDTTELSNDEGEYLNR